MPFYIRVEFKPDNAVEDCSFYLISWSEAHRGVFVSTHWLYYTLMVGRCMQGHGREQAEAAPSTARCDECQVTTRWLGFYRVWQGSGEVFDTVDLFLPDVQFNTQARSAHPVLIPCSTRALHHSPAVLLHMTSITFMCTFKSYMPPPGTESVQVHKLPRTAARSLHAVVDEESCFLHPRSQGMRWGTS